MKNRIIEKLERDELKMIKKGEIVAIMSLLVAVTAALFTYLTNNNYYIVAFVAALVCVCCAGYTLYLRYALGNWKWK